MLPRAEPISASTPPARPLAPALSAATDLALLRAYAADRSDAAFAELVRRHLDLVYAAARRQLGSTALAEEIAQLVFTDLAQHPPTLAPGSSLVAWLHTVTRRTAIDHIRRETRRRAREQTALALDAMTTPPADWSAVAPLLDEAVATLPEPDRTALLLRFFENRSYRDIGAALGLSDDATQKRVSRALDDLHTFFSRRRVTLTSATLAATLSVHAIETAPASLAAALASSATVTTGAVALANSAQTLAMTTSHKILLAATLAIAATALVEVGLVSRRDTELRQLQQRADQLSRDLAADATARAARQREFAATAAELARLRAELSPPPSADPAAEAELDAWLQKVVTLRKALEQRPALRIPELQLLTPNDWLEATKDAALDSDLHIRAALGRLRYLAKTHLLMRLSHAVAQYSKTVSADQRPDSVASLIPFFEAPIDPAILQRYDVFPNASDSEHANVVTLGNPDSWSIHEKQPDDEYFDSSISVGPHGTSNGGFSKFDREVTAAIDAYKKDHGDQRPDAPAQLAPYLHSTIDPEFVADWIARRR